MELTNLNARNGTLAWPLGWTGPDLLAVAAAQPAISLQLLTAERPRLHFVAFVLAMTPQPASVDTIDQAINRPMREVLANLGLSGLRGVRRALGRIPGKVLERERYRLLAKLLAEPSAAAVLHHAPEISGELLDNLNALPEVLRSPVIVDAIAHIPDAAENVLVWIEIVASRLPQFSAEQIRKRLGSCGSLSELRTELEKLLDALPALEAAPPKLVRNAMRIDTPSAIRQLGKSFRNCLSSFVDVEVDGTTHIYHWRSGRSEAICEVARVSNLGWFLGSHLGPENDEPIDDVTRQIRSEFAAVGIHSLKIIETYDDLYFATGRREQTSAEGNDRVNRRNRGRYRPD